MAAADMNEWRRAVASASGGLQQAIATHRAELARIRQGSLAPDQKLREVAASHVAVTQKVADAKRADTDAVDQAGERAQELAFGLPAADRASPAKVDMMRRARGLVRTQVKKPEHARALLEDARLDGDTTLGRAVAHHAFKQGWHDVVADWARDQPPEVMGHLNDWAEAANLRGPAGNLARSMAYSVTTPPELAGLTQAQIRQLATEAAGRYGGPAWS